MQLKKTKLQVKQLNDIFKSNSLTSNDAFWHKSAGKISVVLPGTSFYRVNKVKILILYV